MACSSGCRACAQRGFRHRTHCDLVAAPGLPRTAVICIKVIIHQNIPQACHGNEPFCQVWLQVSTLTEKPDRIPVLFHRAQPIVGHDTVGNIKNDLDGQLQVSLDISDHKRVFDKLLTRPATQLSQQADVLARFPEALSNRDRIGQRKSPF